MFAALRVAGSVGRAVPAQNFRRAARGLGRSVGPSRPDFFAALRAVRVGRSGRPDPIVFRRAARAYGQYQYDNIIICILWEGHIYIVLPLSPLHVRILSILAA